jgi:hypothetical protein
MGRFFSRKEVVKLEWLIKESVEKLCVRLEEGKESGEVVDMGLLYRSLTADMYVALPFILDTRRYTLIFNIQHL